MSKRGSSILPDEQVLLLDHVLDGVAREGLERAADVLAPALGRREHLARVLPVAARRAARRGQHLAAAQLDAVAVA